MIWNNVYDTRNSYAFIFNIVDDLNGGGVCLSSHFVFQYFFKNVVISWISSLNNGSPFMWLSKFKPNDIQDIQGCVIVTFTIYYHSIIVWTLKLWRR